MWCPAWMVMVTSLFMATLSVTVTQASLYSEVEIKLYPMSESKWTGSKSSQFASLMASAITSYCNTSASSCGLASATTFTSAEVMTASKEDDSKSMKLIFFINFPAGASAAPTSSENAIPASTLKEIVKNSRDYVKTETDTYITYIGSDYYGIPVESKANAIIIPIAILTVVVVGIVAVVLVKWQARKERQDRINARLIEKKKYGTTHSVPSYNILDTSNSTTTTSTTPRHGGHHNKVAPDSYALCHGEGAKNAAIEEQMSPRPDHVMDKKNGALPPLQEVDGNVEEEARKERKRIKREKRKERRERRKILENGMEVSDTQGLDSSNLTDSESKTLPQSVPTFSVDKPVV